MTNAIAAPSLDRPVIGRLEPLRPLPVAQVQRAMQEYQQGLQAILDEPDWQTFVDRDARERRFVKRSGWRKIATWFGLDLLLDDARITVEHDEHGEPTRALVVGRVVAPNGRIAEDVGACSISERRFSKPEHDIVGTAATRALNRATANLVGMGELVSAEEVVDDVVDPPQLPEWAQAASIPLEATMRDKLAELVGEQRMDVLMRAIHERYGYMPNILTGLTNALHSMLAPTRRDEQTPQETKR